MSVAEYESILADLVDRKIITLDEAASLLSRFLRGDFEEDGLPLPFEQASRKGDDNTLLLLFLSLIPHPNQQSGRITLNNRRGKRDRARSMSEERIIALSVALSEGEITISEWQREMMVIVGGSITAQWMIGYGRLDGQSPMGDEIGTQYQFLYRYASELHVLNELGRQRSEEYIAHRSLSYLGAAWAAWFVGNESLGGGDGYVSQYIAKDDRSTCNPCRSAVGYYRLGQGPLPGQICLGGGACRCERIMIYAPEIARNLV